jgi:putative ABC transport system permease protein
LLLGEQGFAIARVIVQEPDRGAGFMSFAPRVMLAPTSVAWAPCLPPA